MALRPLKEVLAEKEAALGVKLGSFPVASNGPEVAYWAEGNEPLRISRVPVEGATRLLTVERAEDLERAEALYGPVEGSFVRVLPALGENGEALRQTLQYAGAAAIRVEPGAVEGLPDLAGPDPDGTPRELALARARGLRSEHVEAVVEEVERALLEAAL